MSEIVVDTNVLAHSVNASESRHGATTAFFIALRDSDWFWCLDERFHPDESRNRSPIYSEYVEHGGKSGLGMQVLAELARNKRLRLKPAVSRSVRDKVRAAVCDPTDRIFAETASSTETGILVSHDLSAFTASAKALLRKQVEVFVLEADEVELS